VSVLRWFWQPYDDGHQEASASQRRSPKPLAMETPRRPPTKHMRNWVRPVPSQVILATKHILREVEIGTNCSAADRWMGHRLFTCT
jgi:hypothetical protein